MRSLTKNLASRAAVRAGRWLHRKKATLLCYHRFEAWHEAQFRRQCEHLRRYHRVISLSQLAHALRNGGAPPNNAVVLTVDDGHRDFYTRAFPILRAYGFAATMYLPTAFLDRAEGREWLWFDRFNYAFRHSPLTDVEIPPLTPGAPPLGFSIDCASARAAACECVATAAQWRPAAVRDAYCDRVAAALQVKIPARPPEEFAPLTWDEVRSMSRSGIEFGAHTVTHPILQTLKTPEELEYEIWHCKLRIEQELQLPAVHFAYPSGRANEIPAAAKQAVEWAGFLTAVTTLPGQAGQGDNLLWLPRVGAELDGPPLWFERCAAAVRVA